MGCFWHCTHELPLMLSLCFIQGGTVILSGPGGPAVASVTPQTSELVGVVVHNTLLIHLLFILGCIFFNQKGGPGAAVEPTVCNRKVPGSSPSLCTFVWGKAWGLKTTLPQTPHSAGSLRHWVRPFNPMV